jgi:hypothetical protein
VFQLAEHNVMVYLFAILIGFTVGGAIGMLYTSRWLRQLENANDKKIVLGKGDCPKYGK